MFNKTKKLYKHSFWQQFRDARAIGLAIFGIIALMVTWSGIKAVQTNYGLQKQISALQQQNEVAQLQNNNQQLQNEYYETDEFLDLSARRQFGLAAPGEKVLIVPEKVALAYAKDLPAERSVAPADTSQSPKPVFQQNFEHWIDFFLHRPTTE